MVPLASQEANGDGSDVEEAPHRHSRANGTDQRSHDHDEDLGDDHVMARHDRR